MARTPWKKVIGTEMCWTPGPLLSTMSLDNLSLSYIFQSIRFTDHENQLSKRKRLVYQGTYSFVRGTATKAQFQWLLSLIL